MIPAFAITRDGIKHKLRFLHHGLGPPRGGTGNTDSSSETEETRKETHHIGLRGPVPGHRTDGRSRTGRPDGRKPDEFRTDARGGTPPDFRLHPRHQRRASPRGSAPDPVRHLGETLLFPAGQQLPEPRLRHLRRLGREPEHPVLLRGNHHFPARREGNRPGRRPGAVQVPDPLDGRRLPLGPGSPVRRVGAHRFQGRRHDPAQAGSDPPPGLRLRGRLSVLRPQGIGALFRGLRRELERPGGETRHRQGRIGRRQQAPVRQARRVRGRLPREQGHRQGSPQSLRVRAREAHGMGDNKTAEGRAANRRVELLRND